MSPGPPADGPAAAVGRAAPRAAGESMGQAVWRRFRSHPGARWGVIVLALITLSAMLAPLSPYSPVASDMSARLEPPSLQHPMGTDSLGRDLLTRILYGGRVSLRVGLLVMLITLAIGIPIGASAGYFGGRIESVLMRLTDAALSLPSLLILILLSALLTEVQVPLLSANSVLTVSLVIGVLSWMTVARLVRASYLTIRDLDFVMASRCLGASNTRLMVRHILPNAVGPIIVEATLVVGYAIMEESGLSFLGFGIQPPIPSWGNLLSDAQNHLTRHPWLAIFPGIMIFLTIISVNYIGDGLRDALDPHKLLRRVGEA